MKKGLLFLVTVISLTFNSNAQFKRTFLNNYNDLNILKLKILDSDVGNMKLLSLHPDGSATTFKLKVSEINTIGDLVSATDFSLNIPSASGKIVYISNGFETATDYIFSLLIKSTSNQTLSFFKVSKTTGQVIQSFETPDTFLLGFVETQRINNELVTYMVKTGGGLYRTSISFSNLNTYYTELVDASVSISVGNSSFVNCKRSTELELIGGKELSIMSYQGDFKIYVRNSLNNYTPNFIAGSNGSGVHILPLSNDTLLACDAVSWYKVNSSAQVLASGSFSTGSNFVQHLIVKKPNGFYRLGKTGSIRFENLDDNFNVLSSDIHSGVSFMNEFVSRQDQQIFLGTSAFLLADYDLYGNDKEAYQVFLQLIKNDSFDFNRTQEYQTQFKKDNMEMRFSENSRVVNNGGSAAGQGVSFNKNKRLAYAFSQVYTGITQTGDTIGKANGGLSSFSRVGPYTPNNLFNDVIESKYNRGFYVTKAMIEAHIDSLQSNSTTYVPVHGIREWPGNGDISLGQSDQIASYFDLNSNGIYEPMQGDYPIIYGDACFLQIWHDHPNLELPGGIETHNYAYTLDCDTSDIYTNTVFFKTKYISRVNDFNRFSIGSFLDLDNGYPYDDYVGTHVELGMAYCYNGDLFDEPFGSEAGFADTLPAQGFMVLKGNKKDADGLDNPEDASPIGCTNGVGFNDGTIDNEYFTLERTLASSAFGGVTIPDPQTSNEWERITEGYWPDGTPLFYGGNGNVFSNTTTFTKARFIFPGGSDTLFYGTDGINPGFDWTPIQTAASSGPVLPPTDYRIYASHGSRAFTLTDTIEFDYVYLVYYDSTHASTSFTEPLAGLFAKAEKIKQAYNQNAGPCGTNFNPIEEDLSVKEADLLQIGVYPNPTTGIIHFSGINQAATDVVVYDGSGRILKTATIKSETDFIDLSDLQGNLFFVKIQQGQKVLTQKIIKY